MSSATLLERVRFRNLNIYCIKNDTTITPTIKQGRVWESWMEIFISHFYIPNTDILDIGANIGATTFQQLLKYKSNRNIVHLFEPYFGDIIEKTINENKLQNHVKLYKYAVSNKNKVLDIQPPNLSVNDNFGGYSINKNEVLDKGNYNCFALDHFKFKNISLIKMDVENHELLAMHGMRQTLLANCPTILLEQWSKSKGWIYKKMREDSDFCQKLMLNYLDVTHYLEQLGYICYHIKGDDYLYVHKSKKTLLATFIQKYL